MGSCQQEPSEAPFIKLLDKGSPPFIQGDHLHARDSPGVRKRATLYDMLKQFSGNVKGVMVCFQLALDTLEFKHFPEHGSFPAQEY